MPQFQLGEITPAILPLWLACFPDETEAEVEALLALLAPEGKLLYAEEDGRIISMGLLFPCLLSGERGYYLYALCTSPAYRRRGFLRALIERARELGEAEKAAFLLLIPASDTLGEVYRRLGFVLPIPLTADAAGGRFYLPMPNEARFPFDGDFDRLYALSDKRLSPALFRAALESVAESTDIYYTKDGFHVCAKVDPTRGFTADAATLARAKRTDCPCRALLYPLRSGDFANEKWADPLPR